MCTARVLLPLPRTVTHVRTTVSRTTYRLFTSCVVWNPTCSTGVRPIAATTLDPVIAGTARAAAKRVIAVLCRVATPARMTSGVVKVFMLLSGCCRTWKCYFTTCVYFTTPILGIPYSVAVGRIDCAHDVCRVFRRGSLCFSLFCLVAALSRIQHDHRALLPSLWLGSYDHQITGR